jgi:Flp pilus assembly protein TadD
MGRIEEAIAEARHARDLDPLSAVFNAFLGATFLYARRYDAAIEECRKATDLHPEFGVGHWYLGRAYLKQARFDRALPALRNAVTLSGGSPLMKGTLGAGQAASGDLAAARLTLAELERPPADRHASALDVATVMAALGEPDRAFERLDQAATERAFHIIYLKVWPEFDALRADPRYAALVRRVGLAP